MAGLLGKPRSRFRSALRSLPVFCWAFRFGFVRGLPLRRCGSLKGGEVREIYFLFDLFFFFFSLTVRGGRRFAGC